LPNETPEQMAVRLSRGLKLVPLEGEVSPDQEPEKALNLVSDPAAEVAQAEQKRKDEAARTTELARADSFLSKIKGLDRGGVEMTPTEREQESRLVDLIEREIQSTDALVLKDRKLTETERFRLQYRADILRGLVLNGVAYWEYEYFGEEKRQSHEDNPNVMNDVWHSFAEIKKLIEEQGTGGRIVAIDHEGTPKIKFLGRPGSRYELHRKIDSAEDFDELLAVIEKNGGIQGSQKFYSLEEIKQLIRQTRETWFQDRKAFEDMDIEAKIKHIDAKKSPEYQGYDKKRDEMLSRFTVNGGLREKMKVLVRNIAFIDHHRENKYLKKPE
jgi:hypothetical protein